jgi:FkbM family methyltransferase
LIPSAIDRLLSKNQGPLGAHYCAYKEYRWGDPYLRLVRELAAPDRISVDVGAHVGDWTYFMRRHSARCVAFECNPTLAGRLRCRFGRSVDVREEAVSETAGMIELRVPTAPKGLGRATIEPRNPLDGFDDVSRVMVKTVRLDDAVVGSVRLIKVDVEGHELSVLRGASRILERDHPSLILELEDRHAPGCKAEVCVFLSRFGYLPYALRDSTLAPVYNSAVEADGNYVFKVKERA